MKIRKIAELLQRSPSTISRELKRNLSDNIYNPANAQEKYYIRRQECHRKQINDDRIISYIKKKIDLHWSPEEIANRETNDIDYIPSTSTIYRMIHRGEIEKDTFEKLRRKGQYKRPAETRGKFNDGGRKIKKRPKSVYSRKELGHWEADTVESGRYDHNRKSKYCFVTLAERKSRYYIAVLVPDRKAEHVTQAIINALSKMPNDLVKTITFDRGKEFAGYERIENELKCATYFCDPYCAWQKGTNENTNGLLREFYPKGMDLSEVDEDELSVNLTLMNTRPRKCIQFKTPEEVLFG
jgi:IS30 family transposase